MALLTEFPFLQARPRLAELHEACCWHTLSNDQDRSFGVLKRLRPYHNPQHMVMPRCCLESMVAGLLQQSSILRWVLDLPKLDTSDQSQAGMTRASIKCHLRAKPPRIEDQGFRGAMAVNHGLGWPSCLWVQVRVGMRHVCLI